MYKRWHTTIHIVLCCQRGQGLLCITVDTQQYTLCCVINGGMGYGVLCMGGGGELVEMTYQGYLVSKIIVSTQIARTRAEPQQIVAQRLLSCLQYPVPYLSRLQRI